VRANLHSALLPFLQEAHSKPLWIDALCIDQFNIQERNSQLALMGQIYSNAHVIIWLGEFGSDPTFRFLPRRFTRDLLSVSSSVAYEAPHLDGYGVSLAALRFIIANQWFERCWTLQEMVLTSTIFVKCGRYKFTWGDL
jgi:hypothetical protein